MTLLNATEGTDYIINNINSDDEELVAFLFSLGVIAEKKLLSCLIQKPTAVLLLPTWSFLPRQMVLVFFTVVFSALVLICHQSLKSYFRYQRAKKAIATLIIGYPDVKYHRTAPRKKAKVKYL